jgi:hypothetical protein
MKIRKRLRPRRGQSTLQRQQMRPTCYSGPELQVERLEDRTLLSGGSLLDGPNMPAGTSSAAFVQEVSLAFLQQVYGDLLHRAVDPSGQAAWLSLLVAGVPRPTVIYDIETSSSGEYQTVEINQAYELLLHRPADPSGLQIGLSVLSTFGLQAEYAFIAGSAEYLQNRGGGAINGWLNAIYQDAFNRAVDPGAQSSFSQALSSGARSFQQAADIIFTSPEYYQELVASYITTLDGAPGGSYYPPDAPAPAFWVSQLELGGSPEQVIAGILGVPEIYSSPPGQ